MLRRFAKRLISNTAKGLLGQRGMLHLGKFLCNEARLDRANDFASNGEKKIQECVAALARGRTHNVILDVGANIGEWSRELTKLLEDSVEYKLYAFEPCRGTFKTLYSSVNQWGYAERIIPCNLALSSKRGEVPFFSVGDNEGRNSLYRHWDCRTSQVEMVSCLTLEQWCAEHHIDEVLFLKIDTEGNDLEVLFGARQLLESRKIHMIQFEYNARWIPARRFLADVFDLLTPLDYLIGKITWKGIQFYPQWHVDLETFVEGNYLAVKPEYRNLLPVITSAWPEYR